MIADLCFTYGFSEKFFDGIFNYEDMFGLHLHAKRCKSVNGAYFYKSLMYLLGKIKRSDMLIADALSESEEDSYRTKSCIDMIIGRQNG